MKLGILSAILAAVLAVSANSQVSSPMPIAPVATSSASGSWIVSTVPTSAYSLGATTGASAGYFMVFNSTTVPADGTVAPVLCRPLAANTNISLVFPNPAAFRIGLVLVFSTGPNCFTKAVSNTAFLEASIR